MAASLRPAVRGGSRGGRYRPLAEINVTAPLMTSGVTVDLPKTNAQPLNSDSEPVTVSIKADGTIFVQDAQVELADLVPKLQNIAQNNPDRRIFVRGDKDLSYGRIMEVMGTITQGGFTKVALLAEQPSGLAPSVPSVPAPAAAPAPAAVPAPAGSGPRRPGR
jgi:biopolymer transport protein TolR